MLTASVVALAAQIGVRPAELEERPLIFFRSEPSWSVALVEPGVARLSFPHAPPVTYRHRHFAARVRMAADRKFPRRSGTAGVGRLPRLPQFAQS